MTVSRSLPVLGAAPETRSHAVFPVAPDPVRPEVGRDARAVRLDIDPIGPASGPRIALVTLGCDKNTVDSERMMAALVGHGARVSSEVEGADVVIVNTCGFIEAAKEQSVGTILEACALKERGGVRAVVAVGCMVQRYRDDLQREIPEVDLFMGLTDLQALVPELRRRDLLPAEDAVPLMERPLRILSSETPHSSFLKISEGCDHTCSFCAIPLMRGLHRSAPLEELVREARGLGEAGVRELNIVSQDTTWYGRDLRRKDRSAPLLPDLLRALLDGTDVDWYRLFYMYPSGLTHELVELLAEGSTRREGPRLVPYLDVPLQHGSDRMLAAMRRPERRATIRERVGWLRDAVPGLTLRTTVIVGHPGETDDDFQELLDLLEEMAFDRVGAFTYSPEEGTRAASMADPVPASLAKERLEELMDVQRGISFDRNLDHVGRVRTVLVDRLVDDDPEHGAQGRTEGQAPEVDGVTNLLADGALAGVAPGAMVDVEIVDALEYDLVGRVVA
ncbi:MAG: 30S ribosomal protein S12 methylthiotransferase RimO [Gemmatimonadetes bacterium]|nr:30S ribosomal protein S12 methylthiotransferase RimO [Gemmatimonadota bacterium]